MFGVGPKSPLPGHTTLTNGEFRFVHSTNFPLLLDRLNSCLVVCTYQAGKLALLRPRNGRLSLLLRSFDKVMGCAVGRDRLAVGTRNAVWYFDESDDSADGEHTSCFLPRRCHVTGEVDLHEMSWCGNELWGVNTRFSCLCTLDDRYSFVPRWFPSFIDRVAAEDCCHLNGMATESGIPKYVTVFSQSGLPEGWRSDKLGGGAVLDVTSGEVVASELTMPHSPRIVDGQLLVLDSGTGRLLHIDAATGKTETIVALPGFVRGLTIVDGLAFVGLSRARESSTYGGLPIVSAQEKLRCGVWVIDLKRGKEVGFAEFERGVEEISDVQLLQGNTNPSLVGLYKDSINTAFSIPSDARTHATAHRLVPRTAADDVAA